MKLFVMLHTGTEIEVERDNSRSFATWGMTLSQEGFTHNYHFVHDQKQRIYIPGHQIQRITLVEE